MARVGSDDVFISAHPLVSGLLFTLPIMVGVYFATGAHQSGQPTPLQMAIILVVVAPMIGYWLKFLADRRQG